MFSPYYAWNRRRGPADPLRHCALNVALYGSVRRWAMTERRGATRDPARLAIGASALRWDGTDLLIDIDEPTAPLPVPWPGRIRGQVRVTPEALTGRSFTLDPAGAHRWSPIAPRANVRVTLDRPALAWSGVGYLDSNVGTEPLERRFADWTWSRCTPGEDTAILYDVRRRDGSGQCLALRVDRAGNIAEFAPPERQALPTTGWRMRRDTRSQTPARVIRTLEDSPFYARSLLESQVLGRPVVAMHESLSLDRFRLPVVQAMLPFRMPRWG